MANQDFKEFFALLNAARVEFLIIGGVAYNHYAPPRATKDIDIWLKPTESNCASFIEALGIFGFPTSELSARTLADNDQVLVLGRPPNRIDVLTHPGGCEWDRAWSRQTKSMYDDEAIGVLSVHDLIAMKRFAGRPQDLVDVAKLEKTLRRSEGT